MTITITHSQRYAIQTAMETAASAEQTLRMRAVDGPKARPTLAQINSTLERLESIQHLLKIALETNPLHMRPPFAVEIDGAGTFTVTHVTTKLTPEGGVQTFYETAEQPGALVKADRCKLISDANAG